MKPFTRLFIILLISALVGLMMIPLAQTNWAEGLRVSMLLGTSEGNLESPETLSTGTRFIAGLLKPALFILIPGSLTLGFLSLAKRKKIKVKK